MACPLGAVTSFGSLRATMYWPKAPGFALFTDSAFRFVMGFGLAGGAVWKLMNMSGSDNYDHKMLGDGELAPEKAKEAERLFRRHSTHTHKATGELHPQASINKAAA